MILILSILISCNKLDPLYKSNKEALLRAVETNDIDLTRKLAKSLKIRKNKICNELEESLIIVACKSRNLEIVKLLLDYNYSVNETAPMKLEEQNELLAGSHPQDNYIKSLLCYAAENNDIHLVNFLIKEGATVSLNNYNDVNPMIYAIKNNNIDMVKMLISKYEVDEQSILYSIKGGNLDIIKLLLSKASKDVDIYLDEEENKILNGFEGHDGLAKHTLISYAAKHNNINVVKLLLELKFPLKLEGNDYYTFGKEEHSYKVNYVNPILYCIDNNNIEMLDLLVKEKIDINFPMVYAVKQGKIEIAKILLEQEADPNQNYIQDRYRYRDPRSALMVATEQNDLELMKLLIDKGAEINPKCVWYEQRGNIFNPLVIASLVSKEATELLLDNGADMSYCPSYSPLALAISSEKLEIIKLLIERGINFKSFNSGKNFEFEYDINESIGKSSLGIKKFFEDINTNASFNLYEAIKRDNIVLVKNILANNEINKDSNHLKVAIENKNLKATKLLLKEGFNISKIDLNIKIVNFLKYIDTLEYYISYGDEKVFEGFFEKPNLFENFLDDKFIPTNCRYLQSHVSLSPIGSLIYNYKAINIIKLILNKVEDIDLKTNSELNIQLIPSLFKQLKLRHDTESFNSKNLNWEDYPYYYQEVIYQVVYFSLIEYVDSCLEQCDLNKDIELLYLISNSLNINFNKKRLEIGKKILTNMKNKSHDEYNLLIRNILSLNDDLIYEILRRF